MKGQTIFLFMYVAYSLFRFWNNNEKIHPNSLLLGISVALLISELGHLYVKITR